MATPEQRAQALIDLINGVGSEKKVVFINTLLGQEIPADRDDTIFLILEI